MEQTLATTHWTQLAEIEISYRPNLPMAQRPTLQSSREVAELLRQVWSPDRIGLQEEFKVLFLNKATRVLGICNLSAGGMDGTIADLRLIFAVALKACATALIIAHNHPSGNLKPSRADQAFTSKIREAGALLDIRLLDHLIITAEHYFSFADEGLL